MSERTLSSRTTSTRVLIGDDDEHVARVLRRALSEHHVEVLLDARDALEAIRGGERFDIIVCDLMMPNMTGARLYEELVRFDLEQASRMIFVTAGATSEATQDFLDGCGQPILEKPVSPERLRAEVLRLLEELARILG